VELPQHGHSS
jgi:photosystem I P700 chlorophyll a apoprotein A2